MAKAKKKIKKSMAADAPCTVCSDKDWRSQQDARTLADAEAIKRDKDRMAKASKAAKEMLADEQKRAAEAKMTASAMGRIANRGKQS